MLSNRQLHPRREKIEGQKSEKRGSGPTRETSVYSERRIKVFQETIGGIQIQKNVSYTKRVVGYTQSVFRIGIEYTLISKLLVESTLYASPRLSRQGTLLNLKCCVRVTSVLVSARIHSIHKMH